MKFHTYVSHKKHGSFITLIDLKEEWIHQYCSTRHYPAPCPLAYTLRLSRVKHEAHSWQEMVNSTGRLRQPHCKRRGNAAGETLPHCVKHRFRNLAFTSGKQPWAAAGHYLCSAEPDGDKLSRRLEPSISLGLFLLAETWSSLKQKEEKKTALGSGNWLKTHGIQAQWSPFCFSSPWQHLSQAHSAYICLYTNLCSGNSACICPHMCSAAMSYLD